MTSKRQTPSLIANEFPGSGSIIDRAYLENSSFRDLCRDYRKCAVALEGWRRSNDDTSHLRAREYAELLSQLRHEIAVWLDALESDSSPLPKEGLR